MNKPVKYNEIIDFFSSYAEEGMEDCEDDIRELEAELAREDMLDPDLDDLAPARPVKKKEKTREEAEEGMLKDLMA